MNPFPVLETERLYLREIVMEDAEALFEIFSSEEAMIHYGMYPYTEIEQAEQLVESFRNSFENDRAIRWAIALKSTNQLIGTCGFHNRSDKNQRAEIGYEINPEFWEYGYMTEAVKRILKYGFNEMGFNRIEAIVYPENSASIASLEKLEFQEEGILREFMIFREKPQDLVMYSLLKKEV